MAYDAHQNGNHEVASEHLKAGELYFQIAREAQRHEKYEMVLECYQEACNAGVPAAFYSIGIMYKDGDGVPQDISMV
ncbi:hypothetical protein [Helicobacter cynogastricus]|uniref:hypothetical protein n=1 Tax=Helicobacter cynogastricus TaxID=329937 RepID=UPI000CF0A96C|nr:hypothetical protein [Helicobacter cynogastricus]